LRGQTEFLATLHCAMRITEPTAEPWPITWLEADVKHASGGRFPCRCLPPPRNETAAHRPRLNLIDTARDQHGSGRYKTDRHLAEDRRSFYHPCFAARFGGVSGGKEIQGWRDSSHTAMFGAGKLGSAKLPMATLTYPGKPVFSQ